MICDIAGMMFIGKKGNIIMNKSENDTRNDTVENLEKIEIDGKVQKFWEKNKDILEEAVQFRKNNCKETDFIIEKYKHIHMYLSKVKIMIITANEIERNSLFAYFMHQSLHHIIRIPKGNLVYHFFKIGENRVVHIEPAITGSYAKGGAASAISEAIRLVHPKIIISLGVAYGANYKKNEIGDVLVGRQHFSYDKSAKVSDGEIGIKMLHVEEADDYMLNRFKANVSLEEKTKGIFNNEFQAILGNMVTGEFVVDSIELRRMIFSPFQPFGIIGGEMEAYGIFEEVKLHKGIHCMMMKGICDWGAGKNSNIKIRENVTTESKNLITKERDYNPKNDFQTLAMLNTCKVCEQFLASEKTFSDLYIKGILKRFWRHEKIIKHLIMKEKF